MICTPNNALFASHSHSYEYTLDCAPTSTCRRLKPPHDLFGSRNARSPTYDLIPLAPSFNPRKMKDAYNEKVHKSNTGMPEKLRRSNSGSFHRKVVWAVKRQGGSGVRHTRGACTVEDDTHESKESKTADTGTDAVAGVPGDETEEGGDEEEYDVPARLIAEATLMASKNAHPLNVILPTIVGMTGSLILALMTPLLRAYSFSDGGKNVTGGTTAANQTAQIDLTALRGIAVGYDGAIELVICVCLFVPSLMWMTPALMFPAAAGVDLYRRAKCLQIMTDLIRPSKDKKAMHRRARQSSSLKDEEGAGCRTQSDEVDEVAVAVAVAPPPIDLRRASNISAWLAIRCVLQTSGYEFNQRLQIILGTALVISISIAVSLLVIMFSGKSKEEILVGWRLSYLAVGACFALIAALLVIVGIVFGDFANSECAEAVGVIQSFALELRQTAAEATAQAAARYATLDRAMPPSAASPPSPFASLPYASPSPGRAVTARRAEEVAEEVAEEAAGKAAAAARLATATCESLGACVSKLQAHDELRPVEILGLRADRNLLRLIATGAASMVGAVASFVAQ